MSNWEDIQRDSALAQQAAEETRVLLKHAKVNASFHEQKEIEDLIVARTKAQLENDMRTELISDMEIQERIDKLRESQLSSRTPFPISAPSKKSSGYLPGSTVTMEEMMKAFNDLEKKGKKRKPRKKKQDVTGLKNLLKGVDGKPEV